MKLKSIFIIGGILCSSSTFAQSFVSTGGQKYVVVEEATGAWCGYCPRGASNLETLLKNNSKAIGVSIHDQNGYGASADGMQINAGDSFCKARPMWTHAAPYSHADSFNTYFQAGYPTASIDRTLLAQSDPWDSYVAQQQAGSPVVDISLMHTYNAATRTVTINVAATTISALSGKYNLNVYILEDSVTSEESKQSQGYYQISFLHDDPNSMWKNKGKVITAGSRWGLSSSTDGYYFMNICREMLGGFTGTPGVIPDNAPANKTYVKSYTYVIPANIDIKHVRLVGLAQKYTNNVYTQRQIANAVQAKLSPTVDVENINNSVYDLSIAPNPASNYVNVQASLAQSSDVKITVSNTLGQVVFAQNYPANGTFFAQSIATSNFNAGMYIVTLATETGTVSKKLMINK